MIVLLALVLVLLVMPRVPLLLVLLVGILLTRPTPTTWETRIRGSLLLRRWRVSGSWRIAIRKRVGIRVGVWIRVGIWRLLRRLPLSRRSWAGATTIASTMCCSWRRCATRRIWVGRVRIGVPIRRIARRIPVRRWRIAWRIAVRRLSSVRRGSGGLRRPRRLLFCDGFIYSLIIAGTIIRRICWFAPFSLLLCTICVRRCFNRCSVI